MTDRDAPNGRGDLPGITGSCEFGAVPEEELRAFEGSIGCRLPEDYRAFLLEHNGGTPERDTFHIDADVGDSLVTYLYGLHDGPFYANLRENVDMLRGRISPDVIPIGDDPFGNGICLAVRGTDRGAVHFWDHEMEGTPKALHRVADSFEGFLRQLYETEEPEYVSTELERICEEGDVDELRGRLDAGLSPDAVVNDAGLTLAQCATFDGRVPMVRLLAERGADLGGCLPRAACAGTPETASALLDHGADIEERTDPITHRGDTPLIKAAQWGNVGVVRILIQRGANVHARNDCGSTAVDIAWPKYYGGSPEHRQVMELLKAAGADVPELDADDE